MEQTATYHVNDLTLVDFLMLCALEDIIEVWVYNDLRYPTPGLGSPHQPLYLDSNEYLSVPVLFAGQEYIARPEVITKLVVRVR